MAEVKVGRKIAGSVELGVIMVSLSLSFRKTFNFLSAAEWPPVIATGFTA
jgi:hypothetical protein